MKSKQNEEELLKTQRQLETSPKLFFEHIGLPTFNYEGETHTHTPQQTAIVNSIKENKYTFVESGHGVGKTHVTASIALWFLATHENSIVLTTAPTERQVKEVLWGEMAKQYNKEEIGGDFTTLKLELGDNWKALGFTARESVDQEKMAARMQGFHAPHVLIIFDEAAGVHPAFWLAKEGIMTGTHSKFLAIGNPTSCSGAFYDGCIKHKAIRLSCLDHPNVIAGKELIPGAVTKEWAEDRLEEWGEDSPLYKARVLGVPPDQSDDAMFKLSDVDHAVNREPINNPTLQTKSIGVDVARFGTDRTVITLKEGLDVRDVIIYQGKDLNWTLGKIKELDKLFEADNIVVDDTGVGGGITDGLVGYKRESDGREPQIVPINFAQRPDGLFSNIEFENIKAEIFWQLKFDFDNSRIKILSEGNIVSELVSIKYEYTPKQKIKIVSKDKMKKEGLKSPDAADSLALANYGTHLNVSEYEEHVEETPSDTIVGNIYNEKF